MYACQLYDTPVSLLTYKAVDVCVGGDQVPIFVVMVTIVAASV